MSEENKVTLLRKHWELSRKNGNCSYFTDTSVVIFSVKTIFLFGSLFLWFLFAVFFFLESFLISFIYVMSCYFEDQTPYLVWRYVLWLFFLHSIFYVFSLLSCLAFFIIFHCSFHGMIFMCQWQMFSSFLMENSETNIANIVFFLIRLHMLILRKPRRRLCLKRRKVYPRDCTCDLWCSQDWTVFSRNIRMCWN